MNTITEQDTIKYELKTDQNHEFLVNSFHRINWPEPFSNIDFLSEPEKIDIAQISDIINDPLDNMIYSKSKTLSEDSPITVYIPSKVVMFKLMRACIDKKVCDPQFWEIDL